MITVPELASEALSSFLSSFMKDRTAYAEPCAAARLFATPPGFAAVHDSAHGTTETSRAVIEIPLTVANRQYRGRRPRAGFDPKRTYITGVSGSLRPPHGEAMAAGLGLTDLPAQAHLRSCLSTFEIMSPSWPTLS